MPLQQKLIDAVFVPGAGWRCARVEVPQKDQMVSHGWLAEDFHSSGVIGNPAQRTPQLVRRFLQMQCRSKSIAA